MSVLASILLDKAGDLAGPLVRKILAGEIGDGQLIDTVIDTIAGQAELPPDRLPEADRAVLERALQAAEPMTAELLAAWVESQRLTAADLAGERDAGGPVWTWGWRPGWMWLLAFLWLYGMVLRPLANAAFDASIEAMDLGTLMTLTGAYLALYMGGHTVKEVVRK